MTKAELIEMLIELLNLPDGQNWVSLEDLRAIAEKLDGPA